MPHPWPLRTATGLWCGAGWLPRTLPASSLTLSSISPLASVSTVPSLEAESMAGVRLIVWKMVSAAVLACTMAAMHGKAEPRPIAP